MHFRALGQIYVDALRARDWFESTSISTAHTRLESIIACIDGLLNPPTKARKEPIVPGATSEDTYYALSDGAGFGLIATEMSKLPSDLLPRRALEDILKGPLAASKEEPSSSDPRNKFVELELAANLSSAGLQLLGFDDVNSSLKITPTWSSVNGQPRAVDSNTILRRHTRSLGPNLVIHRIAE